MKRFAYFITPSHWCGLSSATLKLLNKPQGQTWANLSTISPQCFYRRIIKHWCGAYRQWVHPRGRDRIFTDWITTHEVDGHPTYAFKWAWKGWAAINAHLAFLVFPPSVLKIFPTRVCTIRELPRLHCSQADMKITAKWHQNVSLRKFKKNGQWRKLTGRLNYICYNIKVGANPGVMRLAKHSKLTAPHKIF